MKSPDKMYLHKENRWNLLDFLDPYYIYIARCLFSHILKLCQDPLILIFWFYWEESEAHKN